MSKVVETKQLRLVMALTVARVPLALAYALLLLAIYPEVLPGLAVAALGIVILLACETTDIMDGLLARRFGVVTEWGAMLDPLTDSITRLIVFWSLAEIGLVYALVPLVMALRDIVVAYARIVLTRQGHTVSAKLSGKIKAIVQAVGAILATAQIVTIEWTGGFTVHVISFIVIAVSAASAIEYVSAATAAARGAQRAS